VLLDVGRRKGFGDAAAGDVTDGGAPRGVTASAVDGAVVYKPVYATDRCGWPAASLPLQYTCIRRLRAWRHAMALTRSGRLRRGNGAIERGMASNTSDVSGGAVIARRSAAFSCPFSSFLPRRPLASGRRPPPPRGRGPGPL